MMRRLLFFVLALVFAAAPAGAQTKVVSAEDAVPAAGEPLSVVFTPFQEAVLSAQLFARVARIEREMGQSFEAGDTLVLLDRRKYEIIEDKFEAQAVAAGKNLRVTRKLRKNKSVSALDLANAVRDAGVAGAELAKARRALDECDVRAPYPGRVKKLFVHAHETVDEGDPLVEIVDDRRLFARVLMPSSLFGKVHIGDKVGIKVRETGGTVAGVVSHVNEALDPASATFEVYAVVENAGQKLRSGMTGRLLQNFQ